MMETLFFITLAISTPVSVSFIPHSDQVEASEWIISKDAELLLSKNKYDQTPLHTCLYSAALNTYAMIRRSHAVSLPLQEEDVFHHTPIHMFKSILQRTREMGIERF